MDEVFMKQTAMDYFLHIDVVKSIFKKADGDLEKFYQLLEIEVKV